MYDINYTVSAPGKVILFGEHSVVYKKAAVSTSISRRLSVLVTNLKTRELLVKLPHLGSEVHFDLNQINEFIKEECPLHIAAEMPFALEPDNIDHNIYIEFLKSRCESLGVRLDELPNKTVDAYLGILYVLRGMCHTLNFDLIPFSLEVKSELEVGTGVGSSAAFAVAISASIFQYRKCLETGNNLINTMPEVHDNVVITSCGTSTKSGFSLNEMKIINKWAFCIERIMHGRPSGIDNTTCTFGSVVVTSSENTSNGNLTFCVSKNVPKITLLLISTGVSRNTAQLVAKVRTLREKHCTVVDSIFHSMDIIAKEAFKALDGLGNSGDPTRGKELYETLTDLMELNHGLLRTLGVSHDSLEQIVSSCVRHGLPCKLTGAGGGGNAFALVPPNFSKNDLEGLKNELGTKFKVTEINIAEEGVRLEK